MKIFLLVSIAAANDCEDKGGKCTDWRYETCNAGYERYLCPGDNNQRCCLHCNPSCEANEEYYQQYDSQCKDKGGECKTDSNYCAGDYVGGICGGGSDRRCCLGKETPPELNVGDYYWNSFSGYSLSTAIDGHSYSSIDMAKDECIKLADYCSGITSSGSNYNLMRYLSFSSSSGKTSWTKEVLWVNSRLD